MTIENLDCFLVLAEELSFSRAAERCHITQAAVSRRITAMEEEYGVALFTRSHHNVQLTPAGAALRERLIPLLKSYRAAAVYAKDVGRGLVDNLHVGVGLYEQQLLRQALPRFLEQNPVSRLHYVQHGYQTLLTEFVQGRLDVVLTSDQYFNFFDLTGTERLLICSRPWVVALNTENPLCALKEIPLQEVSVQNLITMFEGSLQEVIDSYRSLSFTAESVDYANSLDTKLTLISAGRGMGFLPSFTDISAYPRLTTRPLTPPYRPRLYYVLYRRADANPLPRRLAEALAAAARENGWLQEG